MAYEKIIKDIQAKNYSPIYFLHGEEAYYIDEISRLIEEQVLNDTEKTFNQHVLYGKDTDMATVVTTARQFPMMSSYQVVIVKEAQQTKSLDDLIYYAENPLKSTILVINYKYKKLDKRKKLYKSLEKNGIIFESNKLYEDKIPLWINQYLKDRNITSEPGVAQMLTEFLGNDLHKIANELDKLMITLPSKNVKITAAHIEENIGISKDFNTFELQKALTKKNVLKANQIIQYFSKNPKENHITQIITSLFFYFNKVLTYHFLKDKSRNQVASALQINPYFVEEYKIAARSYPPKKAVQIISFLREYDMKSKGVGTVSATQEDLLKELIYKILH